jgi:uncharacterized protein YbjT (DUF2867 family)
LPHLVNLSAAEARSDSVASVLRWHAAIESHLAASGVPHTLLSPSTFADVLASARGWSPPATPPRSRAPPSLSLPCSVIPRQTPVH